MQHFLTPLPPLSPLPHHVFPVMQVDLSEEGMEGLGEALAGYLPDQDKQV